MPRLLCRFAFIIRPHASYAIHIFMFDAAIDYFTLIIADMLRAAAAAYAIYYCF